MLILNTSRKADRDLYNSSSEEFIPIACHYDNNTLLTKNGELVQIIQINGINSDRISEKLFNLREMVRSAISKNVQSDNFGFWIHTVRRKTNLDDTTPYNNVLSANIHDMWRRKNYWHDKFVNTLYISIIYSAPEIKIKNLNSFINSLLYSTIVDFHERYFADAFTKLTTTVDKILTDLEEYGAVKLGIKYEEEQSFSEPMFLYRRIIHLSETECLVPIADLSNTLASHQYAVGGDKIEVIDNTGKKFAAILSVKEYQEVSSEALDRFLQLPVELVATEIFYFVDRKDVASIYADQDYILKVSNDAKLRNIKGITKIMEDEHGRKFCRQQISLMIISDNLEKLDKDIAHASSELSDIGIVHVREDINLEQTFWAQLPGNFKFLRRLTPTILENTAALTSLHNFPTGGQYSVWGRAITLLRTEKGTPYFFNFHDKSNRGNTCIYGTARVGKTTLLNFLISEATKLNPTIVYLAYKNDSQIFIEALSGKWVAAGQNIINPFLLPNSPDLHSFLVQFLKIICNHYVTPLSEQELGFLETLPDKVLALDPANRNFITIIKSFDFSASGGDAIKAKLLPFAEAGYYQDLFNTATNLNLSEGSITGYNLYNLSEEYFNKQFFPNDKNLLEKYETDLKLHSSVRFGAIYALVYLFTKAGKSPKIFAFDDMESLIDYRYFATMLPTISELTQQANGVIASTISLNLLQAGIEDAFWKGWLDLENTQIVLPSDVEVDRLDEVLGLGKFEGHKLSSFSITSRMFLIKQNGKSIAAELSIGGMIAITKLLSSKESEMEIYQKILLENPGGPENWIEPLYKALDTIK